jgi:hypothetical protein
MAVQVVNAAQLMCSFGTAPSMLTVLPSNATFADTQPSATIMDFAPLTNIQPFGACMSIANPQVAAATAAAMGVLTPQPCIPATVAPWAPGSPTVMIGGIPALDNSSTCSCMWAGVITVMAPGQMTKQIA